MHKSKLKVWPSRPHHHPTGGTAIHRTAADYRMPTAPATARHLAGWLEGATVQVVNAFQWRCQANWRVPLRIIGDNMWFHIRADKARCRIGDDTRWHPLRPGDLFLIPQGLPHAIESDGFPVECDSAHFFFRGRGGIDLLRVWAAGGVYRARTADLARLNKTIAAEFAARARLAAGDGRRRVGSAARPGPPSTAHSDTGTGPPAPLGPVRAGADPDRGSP